jgi:predicted amidohydrolase
MAILRIALLHLAPMLGDVETNRRLIEKGITTAADLGAGWIVTPELVVSGYAFAKQIGTDWILPQPDPWVTYICRIAAQRRVAIFLSHPERDRRSNRLHNTVFAIAPDGTITGSHRKINALRVGSEAWSTPGEEAAPVYVPPFDSVGLLICADAYSPWITKRLHEQGARILVSSAAWAPGLHGPDGEWERCTRDTGLPLIVCNRTGPDQTLNFTTAESVVVKDGRRLLSLTSEQSTIFVIDWNLRTQDLQTLKHGTVRL